MAFLKALLALFMSIITAFNIFNGPTEKPPSTAKKSFSYLVYPQQAVTVLTSIGMTEREYTSRADDDGDGLYVNAQGYQDTTGIVQSPYFSIGIEDVVIPTYATNVFVGETQQGALHSFSEIYVDKDSNFNLDFELVPHKFFINSLKVFSNTSNIDIRRVSNIYQGNITELGTYTFVFNENDQEHAYTLFVRDLVDEDEEIAKLKAQYGNENVHVFEKGFYPMDYLNVVGQNNVVYYLKRGSYFIANHKHDINNDSDNANIAEANATNYTGIGLNRYPLLNFNSCNNVKILGSGIFDLSHLDRGERRGMVFTFSNDIEVSGVKFINPPEWCFITYRCNNVKINDVAIFGYRQNSDAFAITNSQNVTVDNCFARSGDDLFDVKTLGGDEQAISDNITFTNCTAWNGKARCFGICGEVNKPISNVTFKDSTVVFHDATWNADRIPALAIVVEQAGGSINNVTYENIEIYKAYSRAIGCLIYDEANTIENFKISNITYKNIRYNSNLKNKVASNTKTTNRLQATFDNVYANGYKITSVDSNNFEYDKYASITVK